MKNLNLKLAGVFAFSLLSFSTFAQNWRVGGNTNFQLAGNPPNLGTTQNTPLNFITNGQQRMHINGDVSPTNQGFVGIGTSFSSPQSRLHINEFDPSPPVNGGTACYVQWTVSATGNATANDGLRIGLTGNGTAEIRQQENLPLVFYTNNIENARILSIAATTMGGNVGMMGIGNFSPTGPNTSPADVLDAKLDIDGDLRIRTVTQNDTLVQILAIDPTDHNRVHWVEINLNQLLAKIDTLEQKLLEMETLLAKNE